MKYYTVYVSGTLEELYTYRDKESKFNLGEWVLVPFGKRDLIGLILKEEKEREFEFEIKDIKKRVEENIKFSEALIKLFMWIRKYYLSGIKDIINAAYPKNLKIEFNKKFKYIKPFVEEKQEITLFKVETEEDKLLKYMIGRKEVTEATIKKKFSAKVINKFIEYGSIELVKVLKENKKIEIKKINGEIIETNRKLTEEQENITNSIINDKEQNYFLIKGITGSGKTEVYIELVKDALIKGNGAIFLVPEISLTPQMIGKFKSVFSDNIAILHSRLTQKEKTEEWHQIYQGEKKIVLGVRSAIFAPVKNLKYIIIDEEHETTYKQDNNPRYNAKYVAIKRAELEGAKIILGSATPSIESYYFAKTGVFKLLELKNRFNNAKLPEVKVINMADESNEHFSFTLLEEISKRLAKKEQVLIFLNRKGYSNIVQCKACGYIEKCKNCSVSMSYYKFDNKLKCNYCGAVKRFKPICGECGSDDLKHLGQGTEKLEIELQNFFKNAKICRVDSDTVKDKDAYERIYNDFLNNKTEILLGTQIIAKGFHFPNLTLVGIISADTILNFPDFRAGEKTFNLIVQSSGRAGRGEKPGEVIIQTNSPDHYVIERALNADYEGFYEDEIEVREALEYPPFGKTINIILSSEDEKILEKDANEFFDKIKTDTVDIFGPFQAPIYKIKNRYRYQIFVKGKRENINKFKTNLLLIIKSHKEKKVRLLIDVDPINLM